MTSRGVAVIPLPEKTLKYFSYLTGVSNNKLHVSFIEHPKTAMSEIEGKKDKALKNPHKGMQVVYSIDLVTGEESKKTITSNKSIGTTMKAKVSYQKNQDSDIYILGQRGTKYKWGVIPGNNDL